MNPQKLAFALGVLLSVATMPAAAQTCLPADPIGSATLSYIQRVASGSDSVSATARTTLQIPSVDASQVSLVTDDRICKKVGAAYYAALAEPATGRTLYVIKVGTTYVAKDPTELAGEWMVAMTIDKRYNVLAKFTG